MMFTDEKKVALATMTMVLTFGCSSPEPDVNKLGDEQVSALLIDRPFMARLGETVVKKHGVVWTWAAAMFGKSERVFTVTWDGAQPPSNRGDHPWLDWSDEEQSPTRICIRVSSYASVDTPEERFQYAWKTLFYELHNVENTPQFAALWVRACRCLVTRQEFMRDAAKLEYEALERNAAFFEKYWRSWCAQEGLNVDLARRIWTRSVRLDFESWLRALKPLGYPETSWGKSYDRACPGSE